MKTKKEIDSSKSIKKELDVLFELNEKRKSALDKMSKLLNVEKGIKHKTKKY